MRILTIILEEENHSKKLTRTYPLERLIGMTPPVAGEGFLAMLKEMNDKLDAPAANEIPQVASTQAAVPPVAKRRVDKTAAAAEGKPTNG